MQNGGVTLLPQLDFDSPSLLVSSDSGRQDKIEIEIGAWRISSEEIADYQGVLFRLGAPAPFEGQRRLRPDLGDAHGWIFRSASFSENFARRQSDVRKAEIRLLNQQTGAIRVLPRPLFDGECRWRVHQSAGGVTATAALDLQINPTRFVRHRSASLALPHGLLRRAVLPPLIVPEAPTKENDNFLPLAGRLFAAASPLRWRAHVERYIRTIETAFSSELARACGMIHVPHERPANTYNVKLVETYWEWLSDDPIKVVCDLQSLWRNFTRRRREIASYGEPMRFVDEDDAATLKAEISPGETLKVYAKTSRRIRIELVHRLTGNNRFQFPHSEESQGHVFQSRSGVLDFLDRLRVRGAAIVNEFLCYCRERVRIPVPHVSAYYLLASITHAVPDFQAAIDVISRLVNRGTLSKKNADERGKEAIDALVSHGIIQRRPRRGIHEVTERYRAALRTLRASGNLPLLLYHRRRRNQPGSEGTASA